ncbi:zinc finger protein OZF-like [Sabethes cyaneus]|uniref:zinc finger protein OZF-like n=1 Tax=Sabethes cyaneus TaxID=53552 RepID=UPI00237E811D|nr:zinc finger protein OZF-like [Sabethes cyaneus]
MATSSEIYKYSETESKPNLAETVLGDCIKVEIPSINPAKGNDIGNTPQTDPGTNLPHACEICHESFFTPYGLKMHLMAQHNAYMCNVCDLLFTDYALLRKHRKTHPILKRKAKNEQRFICSICGVNFAEAILLDNHRKSVHPAEKRYECDTCGQKFTTDAKLDKHMLVHTDKNPNFCDICGSHFTTNSTLHTHRKRVHSLHAPYQCPHCKESFKNNDELLQHGFVHRKRDHLECKLCGRKFYQRQSLAGHMKKVHESQASTPQMKLSEQKSQPPDGENPPLKPFQCDICGKAFRLKALLTAHKKCHTDAKPFVCDICGKEFRMKKMLRAHEPVHTKERPYTCNICNKSMASRGYLTIHMRIHTGQHLHRCELCNKGFQNRRELLGHHRGVHTGERPEECDICGKTFVTRGRMLQHRHLHTDEKTQHCDECGKAFRTPQQLRRHRTIHTGKSIADCEICGKGFLDKHYLKIHMVMHTDGKLPHRCELCEKSFSTKGKLATHRGKCHECKFCELKFTRVAELRSHECVCSAEDTYRCDDCSQGPFIAKELVEHRLLQHSADSGTVAGIEGGHE